MDAPGGQGMNGFSITAVRNIESGAENQGGRPCQGDADYLPAVILLGAGAKSSVASRSTRHYLY
ncbi:MAG: hypothetical protein D6711_12915 [Chloroflexi bacterium]|nr:MAG: hypothetical protein D6711_12915 [Chloroflexota bacterium]